MNSIGDIYFAAPDVDFSDFVNDLDRYLPSVQRATAAINLGDSALRLAKVMNRASRAGRPDINELSAETGAALLGTTDDPGFEVAYVDPDVLPASTSNTHTFWYDDPRVSSDVLGSLLFRLSPGERGLTADVSEGRGQNWYLPKDYGSAQRRP